MPSERVIVIGAGMGGLAAAIDLAASGLDVTLLERAGVVGGKMREIPINNAAIDAGPTVLTMRDVFEALFDAAGANLADHVTLRPAGVLARHAWSADERLDLHADAQRSEAAIGAFAGAAEALRYRSFCQQSERVFHTLNDAFMRHAAPTPLSLMRAAGPAAMLRIAPFARLWNELGRYFADPRLRQLFARYATYCGASPYRAPATLMLVAHVERAGVWLVEGGMHRLARAMAALAEALGVVTRTGTEVAEIIVQSGAAAGVLLANGERLAADRVVCNGDPAALMAGVFGPQAAAAVPGAIPPRSLSAVTWAMEVQTEGFDLARHNVFFSHDYAREFDEIGRGALPSHPTVYVCAQDRDPDAPQAAPERLLCLVNAPATGDRRSFDATEIGPCETQAFRLMARCGLRIQPDPARTVITTPADFHRLYRGTGGALYGLALDGWRTAFRRPGARTQISGLYLAGGGVHPGPGVPMAALSGRMAAAALLADLGSTASSRRGVTPGGISMRSAMTAPAD